MPGTTIGHNLALGYAGKVSRNPFNKINARQVMSILNGSGVEAQPVIPFGATVVTNVDNTYSRFGATGSGVSTPVLANFAGIAVSEVKQSMTYGYGPSVSSGQFEPNMPCDVLQAGTTTVICADGTPVANGAVYITTIAGGAIAVGDIVCAVNPTGGGTAILLTNAKFTNGKQDAATGITEIVLLTQLNA